MDIRIGVTDVSREVTLETEQPQEEVERIVMEALNGTTSVLVLTDKNDRRILVPTARIGFVEIGEPEARRVGFGV